MGVSNPPGQLLPLSCNYSARVNQPLSGVRIVPEDEAEPKGRVIKHRRNTVHPDRRSLSCLNRFPKNLYNPRDQWYDHEIYGSARTAGRGRVHRPVR